MHTLDTNKICLQFTETADDRGGKAADGQGEGDYLTEEEREQQPPCIPLDLHEPERDPGKPQVRI